MAPLLSVRGLRTTFRTEEGEFAAVEDVSFDLAEGEVLGIVGESGCGKSVTALSIMRLIPSPPGRIAGGEMLFEGQDLLDAARAADARDPRRRDRDDLPGADDLAQPGVHGRRPDRRGDPLPRADRPQRGARGARSSCSSRSASPRPRSASTSIRTSSRAACASG